MSWNYFYDNEKWMFYVFFMICWCKYMDIFIFVGGVVKEYLFGFADKSLIWLLRSVKLNLHEIISISWPWRLWVIWLLFIYFQRLWFRRQRLGCRVPACCGSRLIAENRSQHIVWVTVWRWSLRLWIFRWLLRWWRVCRVWGCL